MSTIGYNLEGKVALITGAGGGIGSAAAELLGKAGAKVFLADFQEENLSRVAGELKAKSIECSYLAQDITQPGAPQRLVDAAAEKWGTVDILVNSAGINRPQKAEEVTEENWDAVLNINLRALFLVSQAAGKLMIAQGSGRIVSISSQTGTVAIPLRAAYCSSKAAVDALTRSLALEWAPYNVTVNAVAPTFVETPFVTEMFKDADFKQYVLDSIPLGRLATPLEVAQAVLYLASDHSAIITGHVLLVDGGWTIK